jgi:small-conductance mechanosensitive channel
MEFIKSSYSALENGLPMIAAFLFFTALILAFRFIHNRRYSGANSHPVRRQLMTLLLTFIGLLAILVVSPISDSTRGQLLSLIGILLSAAIALSSTTFVGNAMAGFMLRIVRSFRPGDFIRVGDNFGRVTERGLFHIEIQTEDSDLMTLPNLYLITNPVKVVRSDETIVSAEISLGYDIRHDEVESLLTDAAKASGLENPFVYIMNLGDFSVTYRISGLLKDVSHILTTRSNLRQKMLDHLHRARVEIVSPTFMNTRNVTERPPFIPDRYHKSSALSDEPGKSTPEEVVFKKAEEADSLEKLRDRCTAMKEELTQLKAAGKEITNDSLKTANENKIMQAERHVKWLEEIIAQKETEK